MTQWEQEFGHRRSVSAMCIEEFGDGVRWILQVKGLGVICLRASREERGWVFNGISIFTPADIGYSPNLS